MFTYYIHDGPGAFRFKLIGSLSGSAVAELEQCRLTAMSTVKGRAFVVDISLLTDVDDEGRDLLGQWRGSGASIQDRSEPEPARWFPSIRFALTSIAVVLALLLPMPVWAAASPDSVLDRYNAALENGDRAVCGSVALEIDASLPKLAKQGSLRAIRRETPSGKPELEEIRMEGDHTVRRQVIARYLTADAEARTTPPSAVAISSANYKFRFAGSIGTGQDLAYVYEITPRKKRLGLIRGEVWIDAETGIAIHQAGYLVKRPSVFLRRVKVVQDTDLRNGRPHRRITRLDVDTLLVGRAELTIRETSRSEENP